MSTSGGDPVDPYEILRSVNPVDPAKLADVEGPEPSIEGERVLNAKDRSWRPRWVPRKSVRLVMFAALMSGAAAATAWALIGQTSQRVTVGCYEEASLRSRVFVEAMGSSPTATCLRVWKQGELSGRTPQQLEACVLPSGAIGVFPSAGRDVCVHLGLKGFVRDLSSADVAQSTVFERDLGSAFIRKGCLRLTPAIALVELELQKHGLAGWRIAHTQPFTAQRRCASAAVEPNVETVTIVPVPRP
jgi:hypothetical protein